jgi:surface antigen
MKNQLINILFTVCMILISFSSGAANLRFLKDTPLANMNAADTELLADAIQTALTENRDNESLRWENPKTGSRGVLTPIQSYRAYNTHCRLLKILNKAGNESATSQFDFCQTEGGEWKVLK